MKHSVMFHEYWEKENELWDISLKESVKQVVSKICKKNKSIKEVLLDQSIIAGIGNIYANELLFDAKVHPKFVANKLSNRQLNKIINSSIIILEKAIVKGGSSIKDYTNIEGNLGYFQNEFKVYAKEGSSCLKCKSLIKKIKQMGRASYFCPKCQKIDK